MLGTFPVFLSSVFQTREQPLHRSPMSGDLKSNPHDPRSLQSDVLWDLDNMGEMARWDPAITPSYTPTYHSSRIYQLDRLECSWPMGGVPGWISSPAMPYSREPIRLEIRPVPELPGKGLKRSRWYGYSLSDFVRRNLALIEPFSLRRNTRIAQVGGRWCGWDGRRAKERVIPRIVHDSDSRPSLEAGNSSFTAGLTIFAL